ncbi:MAG: Dam family site-specific DNA-(adenine-N6)-methyltransferase [Chloroflexi bacterium]|nr:Dam family site-specific DNA-(adenine-N6)-methyltransferase [Chloroflexota bacterium]MBM4451615.1 Dam family site-specific DNA-(adenine-N6)-methyltransferase [Chloroflexota bacterium]
MDKIDKHLQKSTITNFLRYPGSKRRMLEFLEQYLPTPSTIVSRYVEPFLGGGAVFFMIQPKQALLSDINPDLIDLYLGIRQSPMEVWERYCAFDCSKDEYRRVRETKPCGSLVDCAARILYLNRTCFKGMWRHNKRGEFNVGYGGQARRWVINADNLVMVARSLHRAELRCCDFEEIVYECQAGDFIFADPPYRPGEKEQTNDHYAGRRFTFRDHCRLASALQSAKKHGAEWALTTSAHPEIVALFGGNQVTMIPRGTGRRPGITVANSGEVLITSYHIGGEKQL